MTYHEQRELMTFCDAILDGLDRYVYKGGLVIWVSEVALANQAFLALDEDALHTFTQARQVSDRIPRRLRQQLEYLSQQLCSNLPTDPANDDGWTDADEAHNNHLINRILIEQYPWNF